MRSGHRRKRRDGPHLQDIPKEPPTRRLRGGMAIEVSSGKTQPCFRQVRSQVSVEYVVAPSSGTLPKLPSGANRVAPVLSASTLFLRDRSFFRFPHHHSTMNFAMPLRAAARYPNVGRKAMAEKIRLEGPRARDQVGLRRLRRPAHDEASRRSNHGLQGDTAAGDERASVGSAHDGGGHHQQCRN